jgi:pilus assembly protein CpaE
MVICPDVELADQLCGAVQDTGYVEVLRSVDHYPPSLELIRAVRVHAPDVIFLSFDDVAKAQEVVKTLESEAGYVQVVAVAATMNPQIIRETMRVGLREFISAPFENDSIVDSLQHLKMLLSKKSVAPDMTDQIFTFMPSKAGVGASTIALNTAAAMARVPDTSVLLSDFDLNSGMVRFMLKLTNSYCITDAIEHAAAMDENLWPQLVTSIDALDILHAGRVNPNHRIDPQAIHNLVTFMRRNYRALCFDLSGNLERYSIELMQESKRILMVVTPEVPSLHQAREKLMFLKDLDLHSRTSAVLNRTQKRGVFTTQQVEELLEVPVAQEFPNDYFGVNRAMHAGSLIAADSEMGKNFSAFASELLKRKAPGDNPREKRRFIELLNQAPKSSLATLKN